MSASKRERTVPQIDLMQLHQADDSLRLDESTTDPGMVYRFVSDKPQRVARHRIKGYRPVELTEDGPRLLIPELLDDRGDGLIHVSDTILMACPKEVVDARQGQIGQLRDARLKQPKKKVKRLRNRKRGIEIIDEED